MTDENPDEFLFLKQIWPQLHELGVKAHRAVSVEPDVSAIRLRGYTEKMVEIIFDRFSLPLTSDESQYDRLLILERHELLERRLLGKFHTIRKFGNDGAHGKSVTSERAADLVYDAWTLGCWFARLMRPDVNWLINPYGKGQIPNQFADQVQSKEKPPVQLPPQEGNVVAFPDERVRRIRQEVASALSKVDPSIRNLRTRISMREAFACELNNDQAACADALENFLRDPQQHIMLLKGDAGTGKTFMAKGLVEYLSSQGRQYKIGAPTGRAAKIIGEKTGRNARTLHSLIYDYGNIHQIDHGEAEASGLASYKVFASIAANRDSANTVYIVDEVSLVSDVFSGSDFFRSGSGYLLKDLIEYIGIGTPGNDRKIIFIGDPVQLTPIGMTTSPALDGDYLFKHYGYRPSEYRLTEIVRQDAESSILKNVRPLRKGIEENSFRGLAFEYDEEVVRLRPDEMIKTYIEIVRNREADLPMVVTRSNAEAAEVNRAVRAEIFPGHEYVRSGDRLIVTSNTFVGGQFLANGEFIEVCGVEPVVERRTVRLLRRIGETEKTEKIDVELFFRDIEIAMRSETGEQAVQTVKVLDTLLHDRSAGLTPEEQRALYVDFLRRNPQLRSADARAMTDAIRQDLYFNALRVKFGYAVTGHKAQGGEWDDVFIVCPSGGDPRNEDVFRWLYTAMTRARKRLHLVNPPEVRIKVAGPDFRDFAEGLAEGGDTADTTSPLSAFRDEVLRLSRLALEGAGVSIDDVAHHQYQEILYCSRGMEGCRISIPYNSKFQIRAITMHPEGTLAEEIKPLLAPLTGRFIDHKEAKSVVGDALVSQRIFVIEFDKELRQELKPTEIAVVSMVERQWNLRYVTSRGNEQATIDIYFDGKDRFTKCVPVTCAQTTAGLALMRDLIQVVTTEIVA